MIVKVPAASSSSQCGGEPSQAHQRPHTTSNPGIEAEALPPSPPQKSVRWRDLPNKDQLFILALCRLSEPLSNVCLLPYIFYLVRSVLPPENDNGSAPDPDAEAARVSTYSGILVAAFPLAQFFVSLPWGWLSDRHGRRVSILAGLAVSALANVGFGLSRSLGALLFWRVLAGLGNGNVGIMRTVTAEIVRERRFQTKAFLLLPLVFNSGMVASLALGGWLAEPAANIPWLFGPGGAFNFDRDPEGVRWALDYPYALPALMNAMVLAGTLVLAVFGLRETLPGKEAAEDYGLRAGRSLAAWFRAYIYPRRGGGYAAVGSQDSDVLIEGRDHDEKPRTADNGPIRKTEPRMLRQIWTREVLASLVSFGLLPLHNSAFMHIFPVYLSSPPADNTEATIFTFTGGLGLRSASIGIWLSSFGVCGILLQLFIYPRIQARIGTRGVFRIALVLFPATYAAAPYLSLVAGDSAVRYVLLGLVVCAHIMARTMAIPSTVILLTESAPDKSVLGTIHGAGNMLASFARAVGPALGGWVFALGVEEGVIGLVWWLYLVIIAVCALIWSLFVDRG
ncbi:MFS general substrate transporter [Apiospora rasikravindrae]|uniref:MFS general substrate transporter n=1 Tax=Apiospora rasikravindrae TaxID=990691 RepID=A0ABR1SD34_9PEZI